MASKITKYMWCSLCPASLSKGPWSNSHSSRPLSSCLGQEQGSQVLFKTNRRAIDTTCRHERHWRQGGEGIWSRGYHDSCHWWGRINKRWKSRWEKWFCESQNARSLTSIILYLSRQMLSQQCKLSHTTCSARSAYLIPFCKRNLKQMYDERWNSGQRFDSSRNNEEGQF